MSEAFLGEIKIFGGDYPPRGYAVCDGQMLMISENQSLFSILGTIYGGDGRTTFALPDLKARAPMHPGKGPGLTHRRLGEMRGVSETVLEKKQMPAHSHDLKVVNENADSQDYTNMSLANSGFLRRGKFRSYEMYGEGDDGVMADQTIGNTGGTQSHSNMQPYCPLKFIICLDGIYPLRS